MIYLRGLRGGFFDKPATDFDASRVSFVAAPVTAQVQTVQTTPDARAMVTDEAGISAPAGSPAVAEDEASYTAVTTADMAAGGSTRVDTRPVAGGALAWLDKHKWWLLGGAVGLGAAALLVRGRKR